MGALPIRAAAGMKFRASGIFKPGVFYLCGFTHKISFMRPGIFKVFDPI